MALTYLSGRQIGFPPSSHIAVSVVRNEMLRLPYWLSYYRGIGFDHFLIVDNGSTDGTREFLLEQKDAFVFETDEKFGDSRHGMKWINGLLDQYCDARWILLADADEILVWPGSKVSGVAALTRWMEGRGAEALFTIMLDMYSDKPFGGIGYVPGAPFQDYCPFFDLGPYQFLKVPSFPYRQIYGGVRSRLLTEGGNIKFHAPTVSKVPLLRWRKGQRFALVAHALAAPMKLAPMRGALLHFKMFDDLPEKCRIESARGEHFAGGREYRMLAGAIERAKSGSFFMQAVSVRYTGPAQLVSMKIMDAEAPY